MGGEIKFNSERLEFSLGTWVGLEKKTLLIVTGLSFVSIIVWKKRVSIIFFFLERKLWVIIEYKKGPNKNSKES